MQRFLLIFAVMLCLMTPLWVAAAVLAYHRSHSFPAQLIYLLVGLGFLTARAWLGLAHQYDFIFGGLAIVVNAFGFSVLLWIFSMVAARVRVREKDRLEQRWRSGR